MSTIQGSSLLRCPRGTPGAGVLELDLHEIYLLEARKPEVACVTKTKAPELMHVMERGYSQLASRLIPQVHWEVTQARAAMEQRKAVVMLDEAPGILLAKGLATAKNPSGSADQRENILALDKEYQALSNNYEMLRAVLELLKEKKKGFEMSYQAVKKIFDSLQTYGALNNASHTSLGSAISDDLGAGDEEGALGVGTPKY